MTPRAIIVTVVLILGMPSVICTATDPQDRPVPLYRVTVVERTTPAVNYQYRSGATRVDFRGTMLLPQARGEATVESKKGRTEINAQFQRLASPQRFGREYLAYVLWAISPQGDPQNLGELVRDSSNKASVRVTTDQQAFAMIVTAEPYSAVRRPSDVVVLENRVRPDTAGRIRQVVAKYELMPRGHYTWNMPANLELAAPGGPMPNSEAVNGIYQAQNAIGVARAAEADRYVPDTFARAQHLLEEAQRVRDLDLGSRRVVELAREACQTAEDARLVAERRKQEDRLARAESDAALTREAKARAESRARLARSQAEAAQVQAEAERAARWRAEAEAATLRARNAQMEAEAAQPQQAQAPPLPPPQWRPPDAMRTRLRAKLMDGISGTLDTRDTPRGIVATIPNTGFQGSVLRAGTSQRLLRLAAILEAHPGLRVEVEGHTDSAAGASLAWARAETVRQALISYGVPRSVVSARGWGNARLLVANSTPSGRERNRRVEIVISGEPIGNLAVWDRTYRLNLR